MSVEDSQLKQVNIIRTKPPVQEFQPLGYDREHVLHKMYAAQFWDFHNSLNHNLLPGHINTDRFTRSETRQYGINSNIYQWDSIPELENFPVSGHPNQVSQQYVMFRVNPTWSQRAASAMNKSQYALPKAYGRAIPTDKPESVVMHLPKTKVLQLFNSGFLSRLKTWLVGG